MNRKEVIVEKEMLFLGGLYSLIGWYGCVFTTKKWIKSIGLKYYPKGYIMPNRKIRKIFKLKKQEIPKWLYFDLLLSFVYILLFLCTVFVCLFPGKFMFLKFILFYSYEVVVGFNVIQVLICAFIYR